MTFPGGTILVTGGVGYVGSHTVRRASQDDIRMVILDRRPPKRPEDLSGATFVLGDVRDSDLVSRVLAEHKIESVIHFAADKNVGESMLRPEEYFNNNVGGALSLLTAMSAVGVRRIVFSSSCAVYGTPVVLPVSEESAIDPESPYAETKAIVERILRWFDECHGIRAVSLRYFNAAGADFSGDLGEDWDRSANLIPVAMKATLGVIAAVEIFGTDYATPDGTPIRDYVHVADLADAHLRALAYLANGGTTDAINLGTGRGSSVREVIDEVRHVAGLPVPVRISPRRPGDPMAVYASNEKARRVLGWVPRYGLRDIIATAWRWHASSATARPSR
jgi:UDP-glucose-4-epimerase GalE